MGRDFATVLSVVVFAFFACGDEAGTSPDPDGGPAADAAGGATDAPSADAGGDAGDVGGEDGSDVEDASLEPEVPVVPEPDGGDAVDTGADPEPAAAGETPPAEKDALLAWLEAGSYEGWTAEAATHSSGIHFGQVKVFVNPLLEGSLEGGLAEHPQGSAAVKELYGQDGTALVGWAVWVKVEPASDGGKGIYWLEKFGTSIYGDALGSGTCTGCHAGGTDYFLTGWPLP